MNAAKPTEVTEIMQNNTTDADTAAAFKNPDTRERWQWVRQAIHVAEDDSQRELEARASADIRPSASPFE